MDSGDSSSVTGGGGRDNTAKPTFLEKLKFKRIFSLHIRCVIVYRFYYSRDNLAHVMGTGFNG